MPVRIYALAKELNIDSKELVDHCTRAGIPGKGSALASLTDEEMVKLKDYLSGGGKPAKKAAPPAVPAPTATAAAPPVAVAPPVAAPPKPLETGPAPLRREDYIAPAGVSGRPTVLGDRPRKLSPADKKSENGEGTPKPSPPARTGPVIHLAPLPPTEQPKKTETKSDEPAPQKPDLKLPADAIRASRAGARPLAEHLRRHEKKRAETEQAEAAAAKTSKPQQGTGPSRRSGGKAPAAPGSEIPPVESTRAKPKRGKGVGAAPAEDETPPVKGKPLLGGREQRQLSRRRPARLTDGETEEGGRPRRPRIRQKRLGTNTAAPRKGTVTIEIPCTVRQLSEAIGVATSQILRILLREGKMATVNSQIDGDLAEFVATELGVEAQFKERVTLEDRLLSGIRDEAEAPENLQPRPPVITFLGHVDHGKTSLLDRIIGINVVSGESGGITQHIRAYAVEKDGRKISFVDTPGHEAFTEMRARGANVTDIAVLVVAADDGVMPQTEEAISHARAAGVPIVVALNKTDLPGLDVNRALQGLAANELLPSEWGGDVEVVKTSALTGAGIDDLLDTLLTVAELHDLRANPTRPAYGTCLEAQQEAGRGVLAKLIVQAGTLRVGDIVVCGQAVARVKAMYDTLNTNVRVAEAGPSMPVNVTGFDEAPAAGEHFYVLNDIAQAREIAEKRAAEKRAELLVDTTPHVTLENLFDRLGSAEDVKTLNIILRADTRGSIEAIRKELSKLEHEEVKIKILQATVGGISEADVHLGDASDAIIIGFNVVPDEAARGLAERRGVQVRRYDIIYKVTEDLKAALEGMLRPEKREVELGRALVQQVFTISRFGTIAGCRVLAGTVQRNARARLIRQNTIIGDYSIGSLRRIKDDVKEVREGLECGIKLDGYNDLKEGDILEAYRIEEVGRKFE